MTSYAGKLHLDQHRYEDIKSPENIPNLFPNLFANARGTDEQG
jgi:hypothetical protein